MKLGLHAALLTQSTLGSWGKRGKGRKEDTEHVSLEYQEMSLGHSWPSCTPQLFLNLD